MLWLEQPKNVTVRKERPFLEVGPVLSPYPKEEVTQWLKKF